MQLIKSFILTPNLEQEQTAPRARRSLGAQSRPADGNDIMHGMGCVGQHAKQALWFIHETPKNSSESQGKRQHDMSKAKGDNTACFAPDSPFYVHGSVG